MLGLPVAVDAFLLPESTCARLWVMNNISETLKSRRSCLCSRKFPPKLTYEDLTQQPDPEHVLDDITQHNLLPKSWAMNLFNLKTICQDCLLN